MTEPAGQPGPRSPAPSSAPAQQTSGPAFVGSLRQPHTQSLADVLERVLDKGIVIVGDIQVRLLDIELLTIKVRLMIASVERAREMGVNWWEGDPFVSIQDSDEAKQGQQALDMQRRIEALERQLGARPASPADSAAAARDSAGDEADEQPADADEQPADADEQPADADGQREQSR